MYNDPDLNPKFLGKISSDFIKVSDHLKEASYQIRQRKFSKFPVFIISKETIPLGSLLYEKNHMNNEWTYHASFAEEFVEQLFNIFLLIVFATAVTLSTSMPFAMIRSPCKCPDSKQ